MDDYTSHSVDAENCSVSSAKALRELEQRAQAAMEANRDSVSRLEADITSQLEQIAATLSEQAALDSNRDAEEADRARAEMERRESEWEIARSNWEAERSVLESARDELAQQVAKLEVDARANNDEWQKQLADFEEKHNQQQAAWNDQRAEWAQEREGLQREREELRQKFDLALEDVQRFRSRVTELEQELARRPEASEADSAELVALRADRDALAERVEELERRPAEQIDANSEQQLADLQRRFELAVEDVRELKTKNSELEQQIASAGKQMTKVAEGGGMDWESQKRRLLATLQDSGDEQDTPGRENERITIENTIEMTDVVVAEKDREIAELKVQLAAINESATAPADNERNKKIEELLNADQVIAEHRKRIAQLEREMEDKLRAAELELSVERAKLTRQKVELENLRAELESQQHASEHGGANSLPGTPRRRWLSKLGLSGEDETK